MRLIPGKTKVKIELFKGVSLADIAVGGIAMGLIVLVCISNLPAKLYFCIGIFSIAAILLFRLDSEPGYVYLLRIIKHFSYKKFFEKNVYDDVLTGKKTKADVEEEIESKKDDSFVILSKKEEKELIKQENKILKSKTATKEEKDAVWLARANRSSDKKKNKKQIKVESTKYENLENIISFTGIKDGFIEFGGEYYGVAIEIPPVEFRFFSEMRRNNAIENGVGRVLRSISPDYSANIVKIERPMLYDDFVEAEKRKIQEFKHSYENGLITEEELKSRIDILYERESELEKICYEDKVVQPFYYIVLYDSDKKQLNNTVINALELLRNGELEPKRLNDKELAVFLKYTNEIDFDERDIDSVAPENYVKWAMPSKINFKARTTEVNNIITHNFRINNYPNEVGDAWFASLMSISSTKVMMKITPMDRTKAITSIDRSLQEINDRLNNTGIQSRIIELSTHAETLSELLATLQGDNELLLNVNVYVTAYDIGLTRNSPMTEQPPLSLRSNITNMKKTLRRVYNEDGLKLENLDFNQVQSFIASQVSGYDAMKKEGRGIPSNSVAAAFPWVFANVCDKNGVKLGYHDGVPVFVDFFRRDSERVNSNMVIVGKSGSGKSYATKSILTNLAGEDTKIFILDPENEYSELAHNLNGKIINVGNASQGRLNPFHIITALEDETENASSSNSYSTHLQFLEEFFKQSLVDCDKDALEYLNALIDRMYFKKGITAETNLSLLKPEDYPIFDDLYDIILAEFQMTDSDYIRSMLRTLMNYISKYSTGGRNASIWNGPSTVTTDENFTVFNFQSMLANRNTTIANSQMLLVLKYIDNEIIKNRDYNTKYKTKRKIAVVIDEAHVFIDAKYPIALDFMFQLAKRIRKYNGMQIVITQNIKDFVGSEELARKSTAIINACQYSFIFALSPNDIDDLCRLYEKSGGINEIEQEQIVSAPRGHAFAIMSSQHRTSFKMEVPSQLVKMFKTKEYTSNLYSTLNSEQIWEEYIGESRKIREEYDRVHFQSVEEVLPAVEEDNRSNYTFIELSGDEFAREDTERTMAQARKEAKKEVKDQVKEEYKTNIKKSALDKARNSSGDIFTDIDNIDDDSLDEFIESLAARNNDTQFTFEEINEDEYAPEVSYEEAFENIPEEDVEESEEKISENEDNFAKETVKESYNRAAPENRVHSVKQEIPIVNDVPVENDVPVANVSPVVNNNNNVPIVNTAIPPIVVQASQNTEKLDDAISKLADAVENIGKMNYESIMSQVRDMISNSSAVPTPAPAPAEYRYTNVEEKTSRTDNFEETDDISDIDDIDKSIEDLISNIIDGNDVDEDISETVEKTEDEYDSSKSIDDLLAEILGTNTDTGISNDDESNNENVDFSDIDFDAILGLGVDEDDENDEPEELSPIDRMVDNDEKTITISLEELIEYNLRKVKV